MGSLKKRIGIIGIGGVGGYYGGKLARICNLSSDFELIFIMRNEGKEQVREHGLRVDTKTESFRAYPTLVADDPETTGLLDLLIVATKGYDLTTAVAPYKACVHTGTIILPLLNGIENTEILQGIFPEATVLKGCAYIVSKIETPGHIVERGSFNEILFGPEFADEEKLAWFIKILEEAGINYKYSEAINTALWRKFLFVGAIGTLTSYLDKPIGFILETEEHKETILALMKEIAQLAHLKGVDLGQDALAETLEKMGTLPYETTSSLHHDFKNGNRTELESFAGYVVKTSKQHHMEAPCHEHIYTALKAREQVR
jgi:2-dehydropantoate 2-reductase